MCRSRTNWPATAYYLVPEAVGYWETAAAYFFFLFAAKSCGLLGTCDPVLSATNGSGLLGICTCICAAIRCQHLSNTRYNAFGTCGSAQLKRSLLLDVAVDSSKRDGVLFMNVLYFSSLIAVLGNHGIVTTCTR